MGQYACKVCDDKVACRAVDEELERGLTGAAVARLMTLRGFPVTAPTINDHAKHRKPIAHPDATKRKRDLAIIVRDKVADRLEVGDVDILDRAMQGALKVGLSAQKVLDTREARTDDKKAAFQLAVLLAGGPAGLLAPPELTAGADEEDDNIIEGEAVEVD